MVHVGRVGRIGQPLNSASGGLAYNADFTQGTMPAGYTYTRPSSATYFDSTGTRQVAANNVPRLDYDPITLQPRGYLIESTATNYLLNSTAPATQTTGTLTPGVYTLWMEGTGTVTSSANTAVGSGFGTASGGFAGTTGTPNTFTVTTSGTVNVTVTGSVTAFQLEGGGFTSSLIITAGSIASRAADVPTMNVASWFNPLEGTLLVEAMSEGSNINRALTHFSDGTNSNAINFLFTTTQNLDVTRVGGTATAAVPFTVPNNFTSFKAALAYKSNDTNGALNGSLGTVDTVCVMPTGITVLHLGSRAGGDQNFNGWLKSFSYYNYRIADTSLASFTVMPTLNVFGNAARASKAGTSDTVVACVGDSTTMGAGNAGDVVNGRANSYPTSLSSLITANYNKASAQSINGTNRVGTIAAYATYNTAVTFGNTADWAPSIPTLGGFMFLETGTSRMIWTPTIPVDTFDLYIATASTGGTLSVYFDGSATATQNINTNAAGTNIVKYTFSLAAGNHSMEMAKTAGTNCYIVAARAYLSTEKEIALLNTGSFGSTTATIGVSGSNQSSMNVLQTLAPNLTIVNVCLNDLPGNTPQASFEASLGNIVDAGKASGDVLLVFPNSRGSVNEANFKQYFKNVATAKNVLLIDLRDVLGTLAQANAAGYMSGDNLHPSPAGYAVIARYIYRTLSVWL